MSVGTSIEWTDATWNPIRARDRKTGKVGHYCEVISPGCAHCYASAFQSRFHLPAYSGEPQREQRLEDLELFLDERVLAEPLRWKKPRRVFVCSMTDLFGPWVPDEWIDQCFAVMALTAQHTHQVLTKRPERMRAYCDPNTRGTHLKVSLAAAAYPDRLAAEIKAAAERTDCPDGYRERGDHATRWPLPNVWLGVSVEDQRRADERIPHLLATPARVRFLSIEPCLGRIDLGRWLHEEQRTGVSGAGHGDSGFGGGQSPVSARDRRTVRSDTECGISDPAPQELGTPRISWVIVGGESGPGARPLDLAWARSLVAQATSAGVPVFVKQLGSRPVINCGTCSDNPYWGRTLSSWKRCPSCGLKGPRDSKGGSMDEWPADIRLRQFPESRSSFQEP